MATVTKLSAPKLDEFLKFAVDNGINGVCIKKMYHFPENKMLSEQDHEWMRSVILTEEQFANICEPLKEKYKNKLWFVIESEQKRQDNLKTVIIKMKSEVPAPEIHS